MKFAENIADMPLDRGFTDDELFNDSAVVQANGDEFQDLHLPVGRLGIRVYSFAASAVDLLDNTGSYPGM